MKTLPRAKSDAARTPEDRQLAELKLNKLCYNILGVLMREPCSGYDVVRALEKFRPVNISQVYPLLGEMEAKGLLSSQEVVQEGKPNKRIYQPNELAALALRRWIGQPTEEPLLRDDFLVKMYSLWACSRTERREVVLARIAWLEQEIDFFHDRLRDLHGTFPDEVNDPGSWQFCRDVLMQRRVRLYSEELLWCEGVLRKLDASSGNEAGS
ncbi:MAG: PadR family transcriptional regulator [Pararhodobacter sp.]|nr:PadR family transcriptional regulator [Pararhodobacter sp.]